MNTVSPKAKAGEGKAAYNRGDFLFRMLPK